MTTITLDDVFDVLEHKGRGCPDPERCSIHHEPLSCPTYKAEGHGCCDCRVRVRVVSKTR